MTEDEYCNALWKERLTWKYARGPAGPCNDRLFAKEEIERLELRIADLEAALKPFADNAQFYENSNAIYNIDHDDRLTVADLRNARKALEKGDE